MSAAVRPGVVATPHAPSHAASGTRRPRVAVDVSPGVHEGAGIARYVAEMVRALNQLPDGPELAPYATAGPVHAGAPAWLAARPRRTLPLADRGWRAASLASQMLGVSLRGWLPEAQLVHGMNGILPHCGRTPTVLTVHDLTFMSHAELHSRLNRLNLRRMVPRAARRARFVVVDSRATAEELARWCGIEGPRVRVVYLGYDADRFTPAPAGEDARVLERLGLVPPYLLFVGTFEPRKNLVRLLDAYARLRGEGLRVPLVLAGGLGWAYQPVLERLRAPDLGGAARHLGRVADADLPALYRGAAAFVYPSLFEGFGLPVLEAMACGTPVVTGEGSSLSEIAGDAALTVPVSDLTALAGAIRRALEDHDLRARLRAAGPARAARFTWEAAARQMSALYREALG